MTASVEQLEADYTEVFNSPAGERVLDDLTTAAGLTATHADYPTIDPLALAASEGKRRMLLHIFGMLARAEAATIRAALSRRARVSARTEFDPPPFTGDP